MDDKTRSPNVAREKRMVFACDKCRALKVKCFRSEEERPCMKCIKSDTQCVVSRPRRTTRSARQSKARIADLSSKIDGILDLLSGSGTAASSRPSELHDSALGREFFDSLTFTQEDQVDWTANDLVDSEPTHDNSTSDGNPDRFSMFTEPAAERQQGQLTAAEDSWITKLGLSVAVLEHLLNGFRKMQLYYPFVVISDEWTALSMMADRPFLLLAAVINAASKYPQLQRALAREFKEILANRVVVAGEKSLDLLQGLLVHLAWFHFHLIPRSHQAYRYMQITISVVIDLGLDQKPEVVLEERSDLLLQQSSLRSSESVRSKVFRIEGRRAYLGVFYLSAIISSSTGKPNNMPFSEYMQECVESLREQSEVETDQWLHPLIHLQRIEEEARDLYRMENSRSRLHTHAEKLLGNLKAWRHGLPEKLRHTAVSLAYYGIRIRICEMGLVYRFTTRRLLARPEDDQKPGVSAANPMLTANLVKGLDAAKEYLDYFLAVSTEIYHQLPLEVWTRLIVAPFVLYKLSVGFAEVPEWNTHTARETVDLERYLRALSDRLRSTLAERMPSGDAPGDDLFHVLPSILESAKGSFVAARDYPARFGDGVQAHYDLGAMEGAKDCSFPPNFASRRGKCPATSHLAGRAVSADCGSSIDQMTPEVGISAEIETIENEKLWTDLLTMDESVVNPFDGLDSQHGAL